MTKALDERTKEVILLVDDEPDHLTITSRFLESVGYVCISAERGWDALRLLSERRVDLILLDLHMPGMDGYCLAENILAHERYRAIPIVAFSCYDLTKFKQRAMRIGMADFVPKPVDRKRLLATVSDQLRLRRRLSALSAVEGDLGTGAAPIGGEELATEDSAATAQQLG
jgi:two-component system, sensor histidine kinase and response regulator